MKSRAPLNVPGSCAAAAPIRASVVGAAGRRRRTMLLSAPVEGNQARRFRVARLDDPRALPARVQPIEKPRQQDGAGAVDPIEMREVDVDRAAPFEVRRRTLDGPARPLPRARGRTGRSARDGRGLLRDPRVRRRSRCDSSTMTVVACPRLRAHAVLRIAGPRHGMPEAAGLTRGDRLAAPGAPARDCSTFLPPAGRWFRRRA